MRTIKLTASERSAYAFGSGVVRTVSGRAVHEGEIITDQDLPLVLVPTSAGGTIAIGVAEAVETERLATWDRVLP